MNEAKKGIRVDALSNSFRALNAELYAQLLEVEAHLRIDAAIKWTSATTTAEVPTTAV